MATPAGSEAPVAAGPGKRGGGSALWLQGLACGAAIALATSTTILVAVLLAPSIIALLLDREPGKPVARCVLLCGLAACVAPVRSFWAGGHTMAAGTALLADPSVLGTAWCAAAGGWLLAELTPLIVRIALEASSRVQVARLKAEQAKLAKEWTDEDPGAN